MFGWVFFSFSQKGGAEIGTGIHWLGQVCQAHMQAGCTSLRTKILLRGRQERGFQLVPVPRQEGGLIRGGGLGWSNRRLDIQDGVFQTRAKQQGKEKPSSASSQTLALLLPVTDQHPGPHILHLQQRRRFKYLPMIPAGCLFLHSPLSSPGLTASAQFPVSSPASL